MPKSAENSVRRRYRHSEGKQWIEVRVRTSQQLFDARDPAPFRERDLDDDFAEYIFSSFREFSLKVALKIVIYIGEKESAELPKDSIREAIREYFQYKIDLQQSELKSYLKRVPIYLGIGVVALSLSLLVSKNLMEASAPGPRYIASEGITILGWVTLWKPIELIFFDWYPLLERLRLYKKVFASEIDVRFESQN